MNKFIPMILAVVIVSSTSYVFAEEDYDLSNHPIYQPWEYNTDANFSSERFSNPKASNEYHLEALSPFIDPEFDPTIRYYTPPVATFDYCDLESFANYPKCK